MQAASKGKTRDKPNPKLSAKLFSRILFCWLNPLFWYGRKHDLEAKDLYNALPDDLSEQLGNRLEKFWKREVDNWTNKTKEKPSLLRAIRKTFGWSYLQYAVHVLMLTIVIKVIQPLTLGVLIYHFDPCATTTTSEAYMLASGVIVMALMQAIVGHHSNLGQLEIGMRLRIACSSLIYRKITRLSCSAAAHATGGMIINLLANDVARFEQLFLFLHYTWVMPLQGAVIAYLIWRHVGVASLAGVMLMTVQTIPVQAYCGKLTSSLRAKVATRTDERVFLMSEIINGIKVIKMYTWEKPFEKLVSVTRKHEVDVLAITSYLKGINFASFVFTERTTLFVTILAYVLQGNTISADKAFTMAQYFNILQLTMAILYPRAVTCAAEANISIKRIEKFLVMEEYEPKVEPVVPSNHMSIVLKSVNASWSKKSIVNTLHDVHIFIPQEKLYAIVGPVGAGKSSFLKLILGELGASSGQISVYGTVSYASQEPWLFPGSVRSNILFGEPYDEVKYKKVTKACALVKDFEQLPHGDKTLVGERGTSLSGGQCARVNLARAVYRDSDIYLFDDPLSAVDTHVGKSLFEDCINGYLKGKTRVLVTHQVQYLKDVDNIILLNNGRVEFQGSYSNFNNQEKYLQHLSSTEESEKSPSEEIDPNITQVSIVTNQTPDESEENEPQETEELMAKGNIARSLYWKYFRAGASIFVLLLLVLCFILAQLSSSGCDYWIGYWTRQEETRTRLYLEATNSTDFCLSKQSLDDSTNSTFKDFKPPGYLEKQTALYVYGFLILGSIVWSTAKNVLFYKICMNASKNLHNTMFSSLLRAPMRFFDVNPSGRILNRFSKDTGAVDESLPMAMLEAFQIFSVMIGIMLQVLIINWWAVFPMLVMGFLYMQIRNIYLATAQDIKRIEGNAKSPVFSHTNSSLMGLLTIRACRAQKMVCASFDSYQDTHTAAYSLILATSTAFGFWLDIVSIMFVAFVTFSFVVIDSNEFFADSFFKPAAGNVGLAISQSLILCGMLQYGMRQTAEMVAQMTSVERMLQFTELDQEGPFESEPGQKPRKEWPEKGKVEFKGVYLRYSADEEPVLKNLNFVVEPGMKVGIVGRTGAGKSSLITALFRLAKIDGSLLIDEVDTAKVGLGDLRNKISIIPQEPMLFSASLRDNLDPFREFDDATLWSALKEVELNKSFVSLDHTVNKGGGNLSAGQRQLLCLARAIVKKNKVLVLDEATANVDPNTDALIQKTIRLKFKDCTVLTIAHRLNTIMDSDKVLVMEGGEAVEFDHPHTLLQLNDGYFTSMVQQTGNAMAQHLKSIAEQAFNGDSKTTVTDSVPDDPTS